MYYYYWYQLIKKINHIDLLLKTTLWYPIWISNYSTWFFLPTTEFQVHLFLRFESEVWHGTTRLHSTEEGAPGPRTEVSRSSYQLRLHWHHCCNNNRWTLEIHLILYLITVLNFSAACFIFALIPLMQNKTHSQSFPKLSVLTDRKSKCPINFNVLLVHVTGKCHIHNPEIFCVIAAFLSFRRNLKNAVIAN